MRLPWGRPLLLAALAAAVGWGGYRYLFPGDRAQIEAVLARVARAISAPPGHGELGRLTRATALREDLDPDISVDPGPPHRPVSGRDTVIGMAARLGSSGERIELEFRDVEVTVAPDRSTARVNLTATARTEGALDARELDLTFGRIGDRWVISEVVAVRTLNRPVPQ